MLGGPNQRLSSVNTRSGSWVDRIEVVFAGPPETNTIACGGTGGQLNRQLDLDQDEVITKIQGRYGNYVDSLTITTSKGKTRVYGNPNTLSNPFTFEAPPDKAIVGFWGRSHTFVDAIGVIFGNR